MPSSPSPTLLRERGEGGGCNKQLGPPKAVTIVVTSDVAYSSTIFIGLDGLHPHLYHLSMVELFGQKMWLTLFISLFLHPITTPHSNPYLRLTPSCHNLALMTPSYNTNLIPYCNPSLLA